MTHENPVPSGSRWEPAAHPPPPPPPGRPAGADTPAVPAPTPTPASAAAATAPRRPRTTGARRGIAAAAAVGLVAAGGLGGLAIGHVAADGGSGPTGQLSQLRTGDDHPTLPGGGTLPPGTLPGPPPNGAPSGDLDDDGSPT